MLGPVTLVPTMQIQWHRHEVLANNLANIDTPGFKRDDVVLVPVPPPPDAIGAPAGHAIVRWTDFSQGALRETGRSLDLALNGSGFFVAETPAGLRYTRGGAFTVDSEGYLVTATGARLRGQLGPILVGSDRISVGARGEVRQDGQVVDTLQVVDFDRPVRLEKAGHGLYVPAVAGAEPRPASGTDVVSGALEASNVQAVEVMIHMIDSLRKYETAQRAIQALEEANRQANTEIGKVS